MALARLLNAARAFLSPGAARGPKPGQSLTAHEQLQVTRREGQTPVGGLYNALFAVPPRQKLTKADKEILRRENRELFGTDTDPTAPIVHPDALIVRARALEIRIERIEQYLREFNKNPFKLASPDPLRTIHRARLRFSTSLGEYCDEHNCLTGHRIASNIPVATALLDLVNTAEEYPVEIPADLLSILTQAELLAPITEEFPEASSVEEALEHLPDAVAHYRDQSGRDFFVVGVLKDDPDSCRAVEEAIYRVKPNVVVLDTDKWDYESLLVPTDSKQHGPYAVATRAALESNSKVFLGAMPSDFCEVHMNRIIFHQFETNLKDLQMRADRLKGLKKGQRFIMAPNSTLEEIVAEIAEMLPAVLQDSFKEYILNHDSARRFQQWVNGELGSVLTWDAEGWVYGKDGSKARHEFKHASMASSALAVGEGKNVLVVDATRQAGIMDFLTKATDWKDPGKPTPLPPYRHTFSLIRSIFAGGVLSQGRGVPLFVLGRYIDANFPGYFLVTMDRDHGEDFEKEHLKHPTFE